MKSAAFKMTELGPIPEDWEVREVSDFYEVGSSKRVFQSQWRTNGIPFYRARDIVGFRHGDKAIGGLFIDKALYEQFRRDYGVPAIGDLLVTAVGTLGVIFRVRDEAPFYFKDGNIIWFKSKGGYDSQLLETLFESGFLNPQIYDTTGGSTVGTYTITNAKTTLIPLPPLPEQRRIAAALSDADELVASLDRLIEKKKLIKEGAMQRLLTGETRLPGFTGKWEEKRVDDLIDAISTGLNPRQNFRLNNGGANYYVTIKDFKDGVLDFSGCDRIDDAALRMINARSNLRSGDILFSSIGRIGDAYVVEHEPSNWNVNESVFVLHPNTTVDSHYLYYMIRSSRTQSQLQGASTGTTMTGIKIGHLQRIVCWMPPTLAEQRAIAAVLSDMDEEIAALARERAEAERIKQGMMQELLTGKTRLGNNSEGEYR